MWEAVTILDVAILTSALLGSRSCSEPTRAADVMPNKLGVFNAEEFDENLYSVAISREPVVAPAAVVVESDDPAESDDSEEMAEESERGETMTEESEETAKMIHVDMVSQLGQRYTCGLPDTTPPPPPDTTETASTVEAEQVPNVTQILSVLKDRPCLTLTIGWWTYEYCHRQFMRQYHLEAGQLIGKTLYMGHYTNETLWRKQTIDSIKERVNSMRKKHSGKIKYTVYHSVFYTNGTECDLTKRPRKTTVMISCGVGKDELASVVEKDTCNYVVNVHTSLLCNIPLFKSRQYGKEVPVLCSPVLSEEAYQAHLRRQEEMKERIQNEKRFLMEAEMSSASDTHDEPLSVQSTPKGSRALVESPSPLPLDDNDEATLMAVNTLLRMMNAQKHIEDERTRILKKLIGKIQPELTPDEVQSRVQSLRGKFQFFSLEQLRELVGEPPEESSSNSLAEDIETQSEAEIGTEKEMMKGEEGGEKVEDEEEEGLAETSAANSLTRYIEEQLDKDEQDMLESLDLDEEELAELEDEVTAELQQRLAELGLPSDGTKVRIKMMRLSDLSKDYEDESEDSPSGEVQLGDDSDTDDPLGSKPPREKNAGVKVISMRLSSEFNLHRKGDELGSDEDRQKTSALEAGYNSFWEEGGEQGQKKKKTIN